MRARWKNLRAAGAREPRSQKIILQGRRPRPANQEKKIPGKHLRSARCEVFENLQHWAQHRDLSLCWLACLNNIVNIPFERDPLSVKVESAAAAPPPHIITTTITNTTHATATTYSSSITNSIVLVVLLVQLVLVVVLFTVIVCCQY